MPATLPGARMSAAAVLLTARPFLGNGWQAYPAPDGQFRGSLRSHRGHVVTFDGAAGRMVFATALLPDGTRVPYAGQAAAETVTAYAEALADIIRTTLAPLHASHCRVHQVLPELSAALGRRPHRTVWDHGAAYTSWTLPGGGRARAQFHNPARLARHAGASASVSFADPTAEEAASVVRAIDTTNADPRQYDTVHGRLAHLLKVAGPGLRPLDGPDGLTAALTVDGLLTVEFAYAAGFSEAWVSRVTVHGSLRNVLAAARAI
jgi:hypothetical protein